VTALEGTAVAAAAAAVSDLTSTTHSSGGSGAGLSGPTELAETETLDPHRKQTGYEPGASTWTRKIGHHKKMPFTGSYVNYPFSTAAAEHFAACVTEAQGRLPHNHSTSQLAHMVKQIWDAKHASRVARGLTGLGGVLGMEAAVAHLRFMANVHVASLGQGRGPTAGQVLGQQHQLEDVQQGPAARPDRKRGRPPKQGEYAKDFNDLTVEDLDTLSHNMLKDICFENDLGRPNTKQKCIKKILNRQQYNQSKK
jgi:hypothetical protein